MQTEKQYLNDFIPRLKDLIKSETVFGEPYSIGNVTIIPVNSVRVGFGFGDASRSEKIDGAGGGGGVSLTPVAFVIVKDDDVSIHSLNSGTIENLVGKAPELLDKLASVVQKFTKKSRDSEE